MEKTERAALQSRVRRRAIQARTRQNESEVEGRDNHHDSSETNKRKPTTKLRSTIHSFLLRRLRHSRGGEKERAKDTEEEVSARKRGWGRGKVHSEARAGEREQVLVNCLYARTYLKR